MEKMIDELISTHMHIGQALAKKSKISFEEKAATILQYNSLRIIRQNDNKLTIKQLSEELSLSMSSATQLVERLVNAGFVKKANDKNDKRVNLLSMTKTGEIEFEKLSARIRERMKKIFPKLPKEDVEHLLRINKKILENIKKS